MFGVGVLTVLNTSLRSWNMLTVKAKVRVGLLQPTAIRLLAHDFGILKLRVPQVRC